MAHNPKKVVAALNAHGAKVGEIVLREFTPSTITIMQEIKSPLMQSKGKVEMSDLDILRLVFVLAHPAGHTFGFLSEGLKAFDQAVIEFGDTIPIDDMPRLGRRLLELFSRAMSTAPRAQSAEAENASKKDQGAALTSSPTSPAREAASVGS
jgi:hypothetical protein